MVEKKLSSNKQSTQKTKRERKQRATVSSFSDLEAKVQKKKIDSVKNDEKSKTFSVGKIKDRIELEPKKEKRAPIRLVLIFIFSLVFFLFSLYKVFIYKTSYDFNSTHEPQNDETRSLETIQLDDLVNSSGSTDTNFPIIQDIGTVDAGSPTLEKSDDIELIENFYSYLANNQIDEMNALVDTPLKNSINWQNHWNKKNIKIFTRHLAQTMLLENVFLIPSNTHSDKQARRYSYTLKYTLDTNHSFEEEWQVTLISKGDKTLISEIMCNTNGCSHSPFFWPQNYNLK